MDSVTQDCKVPTIIFEGDDILVQAFIRRYIDKARRMSGYENQVKYLEDKLLEIDSYFKADRTRFHKIPKQG